MAAPTAAPGSMRKRPARATPPRIKPAESRIFLSADRRDGAPGSSLGPSPATGLPLLLLALFQVLSRPDGGPVQAPHARGEAQRDPDDRQPGTGPEPLVQVVPDRQAEDDRNGHFQAQGAVLAQFPEELFAVLLVGHGDKNLIFLSRIRRGRQREIRARASRAAAIVRSSCPRVWASETNPASNCEGAM